MSLRHFFSGLMVTTLAQVLLSGIFLLAYPPLKAHLGFILMSIAVMLLVCVMVFVAARIIARNPKGAAYIRLVMVAVFLKILVCLALIIGYTKGFSPADHTFVWPFLMIYITSTIYEVIFLDRTAKQTKSTQA